MFKVWCKTQDGWRKAEEVFETEGEAIVWASCVWQDDPEVIGFRVESD